MSVVRCELPEGSKSWRPDPFPGSVFAQEQGCVCPEEQPWPGALLFDTNCLVHELEKVSDA